MLDSFYIVGKNTPISGVWYKLVIKDTHFCVSCGSDLEKILKVLKTYVKRYRTSKRLLSAMSKLECSRLSPATFERGVPVFRLFSRLSHSGAAAGSGCGRQRVPRESAA